MLILVTSRADLSLFAIPFLVWNAVTFYYLITGKIITRCLTMHEDS